MQHATWQHTGPYQREAGRNAGAAAPVIDILRDVTEGERRQQAAHLRVRDTCLEKSREVIEIDA